MQAVISTDNFILSVMDTIVSQTNLWKEQEYINQLKAALYINLLEKTIISDGEEKELPSEWVDDTPRVIDMWLCCLRVENRTEATINSYRGEIKNLFCYIQKHYADITTNDIRAYLSWHQISRKNRDSTINNKYHILCSFYNWIMSEDLIEDGGCLVRKPKKNPMTKIKKIKEEKKVRTVLTEEQVEMIRCDCKNLRDRAIVEVLVATGMRIGELVHMNLDDVDIKNGKCIIYGKGRKERPAFFTPRALVHLKEYLKVREKMTDCDSGLFLNFRKAKGIYSRIGIAGVQYMLRKLASSDSRLKGLKLHPHMFRSYLATYMLRHGAAIDEIKRILGHSNINTTLECYIVEDIRETQEAHRKFAA